MKNYYRTIEKEIREKYGLSQVDLADYLGISLSLLKRVETGDRSLPSNAFLKISAVLLYDTNQPTIATTENATKEPGMSPVKNENLFTAIRKHSVQLFPLQQKLEAMQLHCLQAERLKAMTNYLLQQTPSEYDQLWLQLQQRHANQRLEENGKHAQEILQWKIACLEFAIAKGEEMLKAG